MDWINVNTNPPTHGGSYVAKTISSYQAHPSKCIITRENVMKIHLTITEKGELSWGCNNQIVTHYLQ